VPASPQKPKKSLRSKLFRFGLIALLLLILLAIGLGVYGVWYLGSDRVKTFENIAFFGGGSVSVGQISISDLWDYPELDITVHDLHVWENQQNSTDSAFFAMDKGRIRLRADVFNTDTILIRQVTYTGGHLRLIKDDEDQNAAERMQRRRPLLDNEPGFKIIGAPDLIAEVESVDFLLSNPKSDKQYEAFIASMDV